MEFIVLRRKLSILLFFTLIALPLVTSPAYAYDERNVLNRDYVGLRVEVYAPSQGYPGENVSVRIRLEALDDLRNVSATLFVWGSQSEGDSPWGVATEILDIAAFSNTTVHEDTYVVEVLSDVDPGLLYGILTLDWSVARGDVWEHTWDRASFRVTYLKNDVYEQLVADCTALQRERQTVGTHLNLFLAFSAILALTTAYFAMKTIRSR